MLIDLPSVNYRKDLPAEKVQQVRACVLEGKIPKVPPGIPAHAWHKAWETWASQPLDDRHPTLATLLETDCPTCGGGWGQPLTALIKVAPDPVHRVPRLKTCVCFQQRQLLERLIRVDRELDGCLKVQGSPLDVEKSGWIEASPDRFWASVRHLLTTTKGLELDVVSDADLEDAARPKAFKRGDSEDDDSDEPGSLYELVAAKKAVPLLIIRVGYATTKTREDQVQAAWLARAGRNLLTWIWVDGIGAPYTPGRVLSKILATTRAYRGVL